MVEYPSNGRALLLSTKEIDLRQGIRRQESQVTQQAGTGDDILKAVLFEGYSEDNLVAERGVEDVDEEVAPVPCSTSVAMKAF